MSCLLIRSNYGRTFLISISRMSTWVASLSTATAANWRGWVGGSSFVGHLRVVTVLPVSSVTHELDTAVGQSHAVLSTDNVSIADSLMRVIDGGLGVIHGIVEFKRHSWFVDMLSGGEEKKKKRM